MADPDLEKPYRAAVMQIMGGIENDLCDCRELVRVARRAGSRWGERGEVDVLCRPRLPALASYPLAVEVKTKAAITDPYAAEWIEQAASYVGAHPLDLDWPPVAASFLWLVDARFKPGDDEMIVTRFLQLAQRFNIGHARRAPGGGIELCFGFAALWSERRSLDPTPAWPVDGWSLHRAVPLLSRGPV